MKKWLKWLLVGFAACICNMIMQQSTHALDLSVPVTTLWANYSAPVYYLSNSYGTGVGCVSGYGCYSSDSPGKTWRSVLNTDSIRKFYVYLPDALTLSPGDFVEFDMYIRTEANDDALDFRLGPMKSDTSRASLLKLETVRSTNNQSQIRFTFVIEGSGNWSGNGKYIYVGSSRCADCNIMWANAPGTEVAAGVMNFYRRSTNVNYSQDLQDLKNGVTNLGNKVDNINKDVEDKTEQNAQNAQNQGNNSSESASQASTGLINAIGGFVGAITSASASNCNIVANLNHLDLGTLDLCDFQVPSFIQIIGSLILISLIIPFAIIMFKRFIGLFRSFQG